MKVICAWCRTEGKPGFLREVTPLEDTGETHGICREHQRALLADVARGDRAEPTPGQGRRAGENDRELLRQVIMKLRQELIALRAENAALTTAHNEALAILGRFMRDAGRDTHGRTGDVLLAVDAALRTRPCDPSYITPSESC